MALNLSIHAGWATKPVCQWVEKGDRHLATVFFFEDFALSSEPVPVFQPFGNRGPARSHSNAASSVLKKGDRHLAAVFFFEDFALSSEPVPVFHKEVVSQSTVRRNIAGAPGKKAVPRSRGDAPSGPSIGKCQAVIV
jgi:hypothetical protein